MASDTPLFNYLQQLPKEDRLPFLQRLAQASGHSVLHVRNVAYGTASASAALAAQAEVLTAGVLLREHFRLDAHIIWPVNGLVNRPIVTQFQRGKLAGKARAIRAADTDIGTPAVGVEGRNKQSSEHVPMVAVGDVFASPNAEGGGSLAQGGGHA